MAEIGRVLKPGGELLVAIVHPLNSAGNFVEENFVIEGSYLQERRYHDSLERDGLEMTFHSQHRPLEVYSRALERAGLLIRALREHPVPNEAALRGSTQRWQRIPLFLHIAARKGWTDGRL